MGVRYYNGSWGRVIVAELIFQKENNLMFVYENKGEIMIEDSGTVWIEIEFGRERVGTDYFLTMIEGGYLQRERIY